MLYGGQGELSIEDARGEFTIHDYTESRVGYWIEDVLPNDDGSVLVITFGGMSLTLDCIHHTGRLELTDGDQIVIDRFWLRFHAENRPGRQKSILYLNVP